MQYAVLDAEGQLPQTDLGCCGQRACWNIQACKQASKCRGDHPPARRPHPVQVFVTPNPPEGPRCDSLMSDRSVVFRCTACTAQHSVAWYSTAF